MKNIEEYLSRTEKRNSKIVVMENKPLRRGLNLIIGLKDLNETDKYKRIVRIVFVQDYIVKLQSYDNGTPYVIVFKKDEEYLEECLKILCKREKLIFSKINI